MLERDSQQIPIVAIAHHESHTLTCDTANFDDRKGATLTIEALLNREYDDIGMLSYTLSDPRASEVATQREIGYRERMEQAGLAAKALMI